MWMNTSLLALRSAGVGALPARQALQINQETIRWNCWVFMALPLHTFSCGSWYPACSSGPSKFHLVRLHRLLVGNFVARYLVVGVVYDTEAFETLSLLGWRRCSLYLYAVLRISNFPIPRRRQGKREVKPNQT